MARLLECPDARELSIPELPGVSRVRLPFDDRSLRAIAMVNTLYHLSDVEVFLGEAVRCLEPGR